VISHVRRFFKLKEYIDNRKTGYIIRAFLLLGCLFWLLDSVFYAFAFHKESSFIDLLASDIPNYNIFIRTAFFIFCLVSGLITSRMLRRQREDEIALKEREEELFQIIQGNSIPTFVINTKHEVTHWNKAAENLTGVTAKEMIGTKNHWKPFYSEERPVMADIIVNGLSDKKLNKYYLDKFRRSSLIEGAFEGEGFFPDMGEKGKWLFFSVNPLKALNGNIIGAIETLQDTTERKKAEEALKETNQSLEELVYIASHDLQSPLISMEGFATDVLNNYRDKLDEQGVHQLERIKANVQRMHTLVLSLLDISRLNTKKNPFITFSTGKVVEKVLSDLSLIIEKAGEKVETENMPNIFGDKTRIEVVFRNLVTNSVTYGGKNIEIGFADGTFFVKDDGIGIDKDQLENIFKPGERLKDIKAEGVGMGLTFCRKVINQHNGKIWAESDGAGAILYFEVKTKR